MPALDNAGDPLPPLRDVIARHGLQAKKSLGQNFLLDLNLTRRIARAAGPAGAAQNAKTAPLEETTFYEVGPGPGGLTRALLAEGAKRVIAVERDERCLAALKEIAEAFPGRLEIVAGDALALDEAALFAKLGVMGPVRFASNLPYNIGSALLVKWLTPQEWPPVWQSLTLMFQREVGERLIAAPRTKAYGRLSVLTQWRARARILFEVPPQAFTPPPKVTSAVLRIEPLAEPVAPCALRDLEKVTAAGFGNRRKMLRQSLKTLVADPLPLLEAAGIDPTARAEQLSVEEFATLARTLHD